MRLLDEIQQAFANLEQGQQGELASLPPECPAFVYRAAGALGVAIPVPPDLVVNESFAGARLLSSPAIGGGADAQWLRLESVRGRHRNEFAVLCSQFLEPGAGGELRADLVANPVAWWQRWQELLGNAVRTRSAYDVMGELLVCERLLIRGELPSWRGPEGASHDVETPVANYEVKSTVFRYGSVIHIAGQFQLLPSGGLPLFLVHQRFEPSAGGDDVDGLVGRLVAAGMEESRLEALLATEGLPQGSSARRQRFRLLESRRFRVDAQFPRITPASFVGGALPAGVDAIAYDVDLSVQVSELF